MKRNLLIRIVLFLSIFWLVLLSVFYFHGKNFQQHILNIFKPYLDERLATEIHIQKKDIHFTFLKNFPNVGISLNNILIKSVAGPDYSEVSLLCIDTLLFANELHFVFNLKTLFRKEYELIKIEVEGATLNLFKDKAGQTNYKIFQSPPKDSLNKSFDLNLKKISLTNVSLNYLDAKSQSHLFCEINQGELSGNFRNENFKLNVQTNVSKSSLKIKNEKIFSNQSASFNLKLIKEDDLFNIQNGKIEYSGIKMTTSGTYNSKNGYYSCKLSCNSAPVNRINFPIIDSFLDKYHAQMDGGFIDIASAISGSNGMTSPSVIINFRIKNGVLKYKDKLRVTDIFTKGQFSNGSLRNSSSSEMIIDTLMAKSGKSNISLTGRINNFNLPIISARIQANLEIEKLTEFFRMPENYTMSGFVSSDVQLKLVLKPTKKIDWNQGYFTGILTLQETYLEQANNNMPTSIISGVLKIISFSEVSIHDIKVKTGISDLLINGSVKNIPLLTGKKSHFPVYQCEILSNAFHIDDFLILNKDPQKSDRVKVSFPDSVIITAKFEIKDFQSGKFKARGVDGFLEYRPKTLDIHNFSMESLNGSIASNLSITEHDNAIVAECNAQLSRVDIGDLFYTFNNFRQHVIQSENLDGALSGTVHFVTAWDYYLFPLTDKVSLSSQIRIDDGELINYEPLLGLSAYIKLEELKHIKFETLKTSVDIIDKKVIISQTDIHSSAISIKGSGEHGFDNKYTYRLQVQLSDVLWKKAKRKKPENTEFGYVVDDTETTMIPFIITGNESNYEVNYDKITAKSNLQDKVQKEKKVFRKLFSSGRNENKDPETDKDSIRLEWEEIEKKKPSDTKKSDKVDNDQEFQIEWKDE